MSGRFTLILLALALGLGAYFYFGELRGGEKRQAARTEADRLFHAKAADVSELEVVRGADTLLVARSRDGWEMRRPVGAPADSAGVESALAALLEGKKEEVVEGVAADPVSYGLAPPAAAVTLRSTGAEGESRILLGEYNPTRSFVYATRPGAGEVMLVSASLRRVVDKPPADFRDHSVLSVDVDQVRRFTVREPSWPRELVVEREGERGWRLSGPLSARADAVAVEQTLRQLGSARVKEFVEETPADLAHYGLAAPRLTLRVETKDGAGKILYLGSYDGEKGGHYARREGRSTVFLLPDDATVQSLQRDAAAYRAKTLLDFEQGEVRRIRLAVGDSSWVFARGEEKPPSPGKEEEEDLPPEASWTREDTGAPLETSRVSDFLWNLKRLRFAAVARETVDAPGRYGLEPPALRVSLLDAQGQEIGRLSTGAGVPGKEEVYAMDGTERTLYTVARQAVDPLPRSPQALAAVATTAAADTGAAARPAGAGARP